MLNQTLNIDNLKKYPISVLAPKGLGAVPIGRPFNNAKSGLFNMKEVWKEIPKYEGYYKASNLGRIKSIDRMVKGKNGFLRPVYGRILKINSYGKYSLVHLSIKNKDTTKTVHRLVAIAFIPNPENKPQINHINGIKTDNRVDNLEWCTASENQKHAHKIGLKRTFLGEDNQHSKLTNEKVIYIRSQKGIKTHKELANLFELHESNISYIQSRKTWNHI